MRLLFALLLMVAALVVLAFTPKWAFAHLVRVPDRPARSALENREASQAENQRHALYVARHGAGRNQRWHRLAAVWVSRELAETRRALNPPADWAAIQIHYATLIARGAGSDPWPNCPDPYFNGASWQDTVNCENNGNWLDSPGYYRCGLQFDPMWERHYGRRFCP